MLVAGCNKSFQLGEKSIISSKKDIYPPIMSHIKTSSILSYSIYYEHSVWVMKDGTAYGVGNNDDGRISLTLPKKILKKDTRIIIKDRDGIECKFLSAVCGGHYTFYLVSNQQNQKQNKLVLCYTNYSPLFLQIGDFNPQYIFGGCDSCGAIDNNGGIISIDVLHIFANYMKPIKPSYLPTISYGERPIKMAFFVGKTIILGSQGRVFKLLDNKIFHVKELESIKFIDISGIFRHCIALTEDGHTYICGVIPNNSFYYPSHFETEKFVQITDDRFSNFIGAYAGSYHSFFKKSNGKFYTCGYNNFNQLLIEKNNNQYNVSFPKPISVSGNITGCIAAALDSVLFINCELPPNMPNQKILSFDTMKSQTVPSISSNKNVSNSKIEPPKSLKAAPKIIQSNPPPKIEKVPHSLPKDSIIEKNIDLKNKNETLVNVETSKFELENERLKKEIERLQKENEIINKSNLILKEKQSSLMKENDALKMQVTNNMIEIVNYKKSEQKHIDLIKELEKQLDIAHRNQAIKSIKETKSIKILDVSTIDQFSIIRKINQDSISEVFEVSKPELFLLKVFDQGVFKNDEKNCNDFEIMKRFLREYELLNNFNHPNIVKTYGFFFGDISHKPSILLEYCPFNLSHKIKNLNIDEQFQVISEISSAMNQVHSAGIIHRDLKLESILIDENMHVKLTDFGLSTFIDDESKTLNHHTQMNQIIKFMAPEIAEGETNYNEKIDVYAFGMICYLILNNGEYPKIKLFDIINPKTFDFPKSITYFAKELIIKCWSLDPSDRPTFFEICKLLEKNKEKIVFSA